MNINEKAVALVKHFEGYRENAYRCPAGVWTCGIGATGPDIGPNTRMTMKQAEDRLAADLADAAKHVDKLITVPLTENQRGALASFVFNLGQGSLEFSTLRKKLNYGDYAGAAGEFGKWVKATVDGKLVELPGLVRRRAAEAALFQGLDWRQPAASPHPMPQAVVAPAGRDADRIRRIQAIVGVRQDGHYGPMTRAAVTLWQADRHLVADGIVGPKTAKAMGL